MGRTLSMIAVTLCLGTYSVSQNPDPAAVTFSKDVAPILQKHCQTCHRPGEAAPFRLLTYEQARPWAASMKRVVKDKAMPPWFADPAVGHFANDRSLTAKEISTILTWANTGAPQGDPADMPAPATFVEGWGIPKPDVVFQLPHAFSVPASGMVEYQHAILPTGFTEDKWVQAAEACPTDRSVVHHMIAYIREPGSNYSLAARSQESFSKLRRQSRMTKMTRARSRATSSSDTLPVKTPKSCSPDKPS